MHNHPPGADIEIAADVRSAANILDINNPWPFFGPRPLDVWTGMI